MNFQITLLNYKLDFQNKNMVFFLIKKKFVTRSTVDFQITLSTYKLNSQNKKIIYIYRYIYKIKTIFFKLKKKKASSHARSACDEASY